ncbi:MAG: hypothetical protein LLG15_01735 [Betaproteobacteria bacterium]|nr:hypothetical protein [Betaproteobacteria bacterium]
MESIKRTVRVTIEKEIEIELTPEMFGGMTEEEYLSDFREGLWDVESIDDVVKYAARMAAYHGGGMQHDGLGLLDFHLSTYPRVPDVKFRELMDECEEEILTPTLAQ